IRLAAGDGRRALTYLEAAAGGAQSRERTTIDVDDAARAVDRAALRYDRQGDQHYDVTSALIKSIRGSDVDAALHYLARMVEAGEDPRFIARRLMILASEDIGQAEPSALATAVSAAHAVAMIGFPEARITLAQAVIALALAPNRMRRSKPSTRRSPMCARARPDRCPRRYAMPITPVPRNWATGTTTCMHTMMRAVWSGNNTLPMTSTAPDITRP